MALAPRGIDVNAILRDALHERGTEKDVDAPLEAAVRRAVAPDAAAPVLAALRETLARVSTEEGLDGGDALHSILANLSRYRFTFEPGGEAWIARDGRLVPASEIPLPSPAAAPPPQPASRGGCAGILLAVVVVAAVLVLA